MIFSNGWMNTFYHDGGLSSDEEKDFTSFVQARRIRSVLRRENHIQSAAILMPCTIYKIGAENYDIKQATETIGHD